MTIVLFAALVSRSLSAQSMDPLALCRELADVQSERSVAKIMVDPRDILQSLSRGGETAEFFDNLAQSAAIPFFTKSPADFEDARLEVLKWAAPVALIDEYSRDLSWAQLAEKLEARAALDVKEKAILVHLFGMQCLDSLRESSSVINQRSVEQYEAALELDFKMNQKALQFDNEYRARTSPMVMADVDNLIYRRVAEDGRIVFDEIRAQFVDPYLTSIFRDALPEIHWLEEKIHQGAWIDDSEFTVSRMAFLNVLARMRLVKPKMNTYSWTGDDIALFNQVLSTVSGSLDQDTIMTIASHSTQYAAAQAAQDVRSNRGLRIAETVFKGRTGVALGSAVMSFVVWRATRSLVVLERGFIRSTDIYLSQMKANLPASLQGLSNLDDQLRMALTQPKPVIAGVQLSSQTNIAFREALELGQKYYHHIDRVRSALTKSYGEKIAQRVMGWVEKDLVALGTMNSMVHERALASAITRFESGGISLRSAEKLARQQAALTPPQGFKSEKAFQKALAQEVRSVHSKMLEEAENLLREQYLQRVSGTTKWTHFVEWMKFQSRKYWSRVTTMRKVRGMSPNDLSFTQKWNPARWWNDFQKAGEVLPEGTSYKGITPGESIAAGSKTAGDMGRSVLHKASWALMLISIGIVVYDVYDAWKGGKLAGGYGDLQADSTEKQLIDDQSNEVLLRTHHTKALVAELTHRLMVADPRYPGASDVRSLNQERILRGLPAIEVVANMESLGGFNPQTGFFSTAYAIFKAAEQAKDGVREDRIQNALSGVLIRFQLKQEGFDAVSARRLGVNRDVPQKARWVADAMIDLSQLDFEARMALEEAIVFKEFRANTQKPKIVIDPEKIKEVFAGAQNLIEVLPQQNLSLR